MPEGPLGSVPIPSRVSFASGSRHQVEEAERCSSQTMRIPEALPKLSVRCDGISLMLETSQHNLCPRARFYR